MKIIIPFAGKGSRFSDRGFKTPKPLINVGDIPMLQCAIESLNISGDFIFIAQKSFNEDNKLNELLNKICKDPKIIYIDYITEGCVATCLLAKKYIDPNDELIITNCDQMMEWDSEKFLKSIRSDNIDGGVVTYDSTSPKNSFAAVGEDGFVTKMVEKEVISNDALVGIHYWKRGGDFIDSAEKLVERNIRMKNEFYMSLTYNILIEEGRKIICHKLSETEKYHSLGNPTDYFNYVNKYCDKEFKVLKMEDMFRGWFVGDFEPSAYKTKEFEVGVLLHKKGEKWPVHIHEHMTEINFIQEGHMILNNTELKKGDIFVLKPNDIAAPIFLEDCKILCIKTPSVIGDKLII